MREIRIRRTEKKSRITYIGGEGGVGGCGGGVPRELYCKDMSNGKKSRITYTGGEGGGVGVRGWTRAILFAKTCTDALGGM